jgi:hypothetical protein
MAVCQTDALCKRKAAELVSVDDYFGPSLGAAVIIDGKAVTNGAFVPSFNPQIDHVGNHVVRCLLTRLDDDRDALTRVRRATYEHLDRKRHRKSVEREQRAASALAQAVELMERELATSPTARMWEACIVLTQVYRDCMRPSPDVGWIGLSECALKERRGHLRHFLTAGSDFGLVQRIALALEEARALYQDAPPDQSAIDEAIAGGGLVLVERTREVNWDRQLLDVDWNKERAGWMTLWELAQRGRRGQAVTARDLYPDDPGKRSSTVASRFGRLKDLIPALRRYIVPGAEPRSYRLKLDAHLLHVFAAAVERPD